MMLRITWIVLTLVLAVADQSTVSSVPVHECLRTCVDGEPAKVCQYKWVLENYLTLSRACYGYPSNQTDCLRQECVTADGVTRAIRSANRALPGPGIQVCQGDVIEVAVDNQMVMGEGVSLHWHGLHQHNHQHMDGVAMVTQCPIPAATSFTYRFLAAEAGTHFWHAHSGILLADGLFGPVVVRQSASRDPHSAHYDVDSPDHVMLLNDWSDAPIVETYARFYHTNDNKRPRSILINGRGRLYDVDGTVLTDTPLAEFKVEEGKRYRFRVIGAGMLKCPLRLSIDDHVLQVIDSDGRPVEPFDLEVLELYSGERYDFVLKYANADVTGRRLGGATFTVHVEGILDCELEHVQQTAVLRYLGEAVGGSEPTQQPQPSPTALTQTPAATMRSLEPDDVSLKNDPDLRLYLELQVNEVDNIHFLNPALYPAGGAGYPSMFSTQINGISNAMPSAPLLTNMGDLDESLFCNSSSVDEACLTSEKFCECLHRLSIPLGSVVELVLVSRSNAHTTSHPVHMHGHSFRIVAMERLAESMTVERFKELDLEGKIARNLHKAPYKDTLPVLDGGYAVIRLLADNPGVWYMHCHLTFHVEVGMSLFLHIPNKDGTLPPPPPGFPKCGPWQPTGTATSSNLLSRDPNQPMNNFKSAPRALTSNNQPINNGKPVSGDATSFNTQQGQSVAQQQQSFRVNAGQSSGDGNTVTPGWVVPLFGVMGAVIVWLVVALVAQKLSLRRAMRNSRVGSLSGEHHPLLLNERQ